MTSFETASLYHTHHSLHPDDLPFWLALAGHSPDPVLELGCGTGRLLFPFLQAGHRVVGVDWDSGMLAILRQHWRNGLPQQAAGMPGPPVFQADFTRFHLAERFGLALLPCNMYSTLSGESRWALLACVARHLLPQGLFALSMPNPQVLWSLPQRSPMEMEEIFPHPADGEPVQVSSGWRRTRRLFRLTWYYDHLQPNGEVRRTRVELDHHLEVVEVYQNEFVAAGLRPVAMYGDYDQSEFTEVSPYVIWIVARQ